MPTWAPIPMRTLSAPAWRPHGRHTPSGRRADPGERAARERAHHVAAAAARVQRGAGGQQAEAGGDAAAAAHDEARAGQHTTAHHALTNLVCRLPLEEKQKRI